MEAVHLVEIYITSSLARKNKPDYQTRSILTYFIVKTRSMARIARPVPGARAVQARAVLNPNKDPQ
jgi:hypothetical protein